MNPWFIATAVGLGLFFLGAIWSELRDIRKCMEDSRDIRKWTEK